jgi:hypothetical protein
LVVRARRVVQELRLCGFGVAPRVARGPRVVRVVAGVVILTLSERDLNASAVGEK